MSRLLGVLLLLTLITMPAVARAATIDVELTGVANDRGLIRVAVCTAATFTTSIARFPVPYPRNRGTSSFGSMASLEVATRSRPITTSTATVVCGGAYWEYLTKPSAFPATRRSDWGHPPSRTRSSRSLSHSRRCTYGFGTSVFNPT